MRLSWVVHYVRYILPVQWFDGKNIYYFYFFQNPRQMEGFYQGIDIADQDKVKVLKEQNNKITLAQNNL